MVRIKRSYRIQVCGTKICPQWRTPLGSSTHRQTSTDQAPKLAEEAGFYEQRLYRDQAGIDHLLDGLHKAGMPQE